MSACGAGAGRLGIWLESLHCVVLRHCGECTANARLCIAWCCSTAMKVRGLLLLLKLRTETGGQQQKASRRRLLQMRIMGFLEAHFQDVLEVKARVQLLLRDPRGLAVKILG